MKPTLLQTQLLKRFMGVEKATIPEYGPLAAVSVLKNWFEIASEDPIKLRITRVGVRAFWDVVAEHGAKAVMGKPIGGNNPTNTPPTGGTPVAVTA